MVNLRARGKLLQGECSGNRHARLYTLVSNSRRVQHTCGLHAREMEASENWEFQLRRITLHPPFPHIPGVWPTPYTDYWQYTYSHNEQHYYRCVFMTNLEL